jgi:hypothetical protein
MTVSERPPTRPEANITFHSGRFDITGLEQSRESAKRRRPLAAASPVVRSRVENSEERLW